ncbi:hypothetical protein, partial [Caballeronia sp. AAUFL_F1_KS47]|uniref:hypothetical protein n=1 Tax=Caballeronia sp. AAUFL_F1_KS47 TaxID=2921771 RepID=UPI0020283F2D
IFNLPATTENNTRLVWSAEYDVFKRQRHDDGGRKREHRAEIAGRRARFERVLKYKTTSPPSNKLSAGIASAA